MLSNTWQAVSILECFYTSLEIQQSSVLAYLLFNRDHLVSVHAREEGSTDLLTVNTGTRKELKLAGGSCGSPHDSSEVSRCFTISTLIG